MVQTQYLKRRVEAAGAAAASDPADITREPMEIHIPADQVGHRELSGGADKPVREMIHPEVAAREAMVAGACEAGCHCGRCSKTPATTAHAPGEKSQRAAGYGGGLDV